MKKSRQDNKQRHHGSIQRSRRAGGLPALRPFFDALLQSYHQPTWIYSDPIQFAHRYSRNDDQEVVALIASCFAYGSVKLVHRAVEAVLKPMGDHPAQFVRGYQGEASWPGFYHRFHKEKHLIELIRILSVTLADYGSLGSCFRAQALDRRTRGEPLDSEQVLIGAALWFHAQIERGPSRKDPEVVRGTKFFFNSPEDGSACKRMAMFLRWMVRRDDIDLGLWDWLTPARLVIPVDTHVARISHYLGLRSGPENRAPSWKMAKEITASLKQVNPADPVVYDFAMARLGILDICKRKYATSVCERCPVAPGCRYSNITRVASAKCSDYAAIQRES